MKKRGFSLFEVLIVLSLITVILAISFTTFNHSDQAICKTELKKLHSIFQYLHRLALTQKRAVHIIFDKFNGSYKYENNIDNLSSRCKFNYLQNVKGPPSSPTKTIKNAITYDNSEIIFYEDGKISSGTIYLTDAQENNLFAISTPISEFGLIRLYKYSKKWVLIE